MDADAQAAVFAEKRLKSVLPKVIKVGYEALNLINFFTAGQDEVRV